VAKGPPDDEPLDVIDLIANEPPPSIRTSAPVPHDDRAQPRRRRRYLLIAIAAVVLIVGAATTIVSRDDGTPDRSVGLASNDAGASRGADGPSSSAPRASLPALPAASWRDLGLRIGISIDGVFVLVDGRVGMVHPVRALPDGAATVVNRGRGSVVVRTGNSSFIVDDSGSSTETPTPTVFPTADADGWWNGRGRIVQRVEDATRSYSLPPGAQAIASLRNGFLLAEPNASGLSVWSPNTDPRPVATGNDVELVAAHPDRIAWQSKCPGTGCGLHVTDTATGRDAVLPSGILPFFDPGRAYGRFSPDGRYLALHVSASLAEPGSFVLVDLTTGAIVSRNAIAVRLASQSGDRYDHPVPFDFSPDGRHLVLADWSQSPGRLLVLRTSDGALERSIEGVGRADSLAALDTAVTAPTTPLFDSNARPSTPAVSSSLAVVSTNGDVLTTVDIDTGAERVLELQYAPPSENGDYQPRLVAFSGGFAWIRNGEAWFAPLIGDPKSLGAATYVLTGGSADEGWIVLRTDAGFDITRLDGAVGARGPTYRSVAGPEAAVRDGLVVGRPASFTRGSEFEIWNPATGRSHRIEISARFPTITAAAGSVIVWYDQSCSNSEKTCGTHVTNVATGRTAALPGHTFPYGNGALTPAGDRLYVPLDTGAGTSGLGAIDLKTMQVQEVPSSQGAEQWAASRGGFVVFQSDAIYMWQPGWTDARMLSPGTVGIVGGFAVR
jgi:hypothetical protein